DTDADTDADADADADSDADADADATPDLVGDEPARPDEVGEAYDTTSLFCAVEPVFAGWAGIAAGALCARRRRARGMV
ncbi:MAG: hypothetical protein ACOZNI_12110, partial [Myxococcota bacterium]